jgi:hypothetical protein
MNSHITHLPWAHILTVLVVLFIAAYVNQKRLGIVTAKPAYSQSGKLLLDLPMETIADGDRHSGR